MFLQVHIEAYRWDEQDSCKDTYLQVTKATTIGELKGMKIFDGGRDSYPPEYFTLGKLPLREELDDDVVLSSIHTPGKDVELCFHSCTYESIHKACTSQWESPPSWSFVINSVLAGSSKVLSEKCTKTFPGGYPYCVSFK